MTDKIAAGSPFAQFETDPLVERNGVKLDYGEYHFQVARAGGDNERYSTVLRQKMAPHRRGLATDTMPEKLSRRLIAEALAETVILGWGSVKHGEGKMIGRNGEAIAFSVEAVVELLVSLPSLARDILEQASNEALFLRVVAEGDAGN